MPRVVVAAIAGLFAGLLFMASNVVALHDPKPHHVPIAAAGLDPTRLQAALDKAMPGGFDVSPTADAATAAQQLRTREAMGALAVGPGGAQVLYASADGYNAAMAVQQALTAAAKPAGVPRPPRPRDVVPLQRGDPRGLSMQFIVLGTIIGGFFMGMLSAQLALSEPFWLRATVTFGFGVVFGGIAAVLLDPLLGVLTGGFWWLWLWLAAAAFAIAEAVRAAGRAFGMPGLGLAMVVVLMIGNPSAAANVPVDFLPGFYRTVGPYLPPNAAAYGLLGTTYFDADVTRAAIVLALWGGIGLMVLWVEDRWRGVRPGLAYDAASAAAAPPQPAPHR